MCKNLETARDRMKVSINRKLYSLSMVAESVTLNNLERRMIVVEVKTHTVCDENAAHRIWFSTIYDL